MVVGNVFYVHTTYISTYLCACILYIGTRKPSQDARWDICFLVKTTAE